MGNLGKTYLAVLMFTVTVDWGSAWICMHTATACHVENHEDAAHTHTHDHGPFEHSRNEGPEHVQHAVKLFGVLGPSVQRDIASSALQPLPADLVVDLAHAFAMASHPVTPRLRSEIDAVVGSTCKSMLLKTERWLV
ncbi:MAG: hypothetical protein JRF63_08500 [Deltaproteobacteria bacterium]|nr:hypothetical protein [Deltaproteobacteria bacterium]